MLTAGSVGNSVVVYHPYCMGVPEEPFRSFFTAVGAQDFGYWQYGRPSVVATAHGRNVAAINELQRYIGLVAAADYPGDVDAPPPWGEVCNDPRVEQDEDRNACLERGSYGVEMFDDSVRITLSFANTFAGTLALEGWLRNAGFQRIVMELQAELQPFAPGGRPGRDPKTGLFGDVRPLATRLENASPEQIVELLFQYWSMPDSFKEILGRIPEPQKTALCQAQWDACKASRDVTVLSSEIILSIGPPAASWTRALWNWLTTDQREVSGVVLHALSASVPPDEAFALVKDWAIQSPDATTKKARLMHLTPFKKPEVVPMVEEWWGQPEVQESSTRDWRDLVAASGLSWETARRWLENGRPLSLVALDVLQAYHEKKEVPAVFHGPSREEFLAVLQDYQQRDKAPRPSRIIQRLVANAAPLA